VLGEKMTYPFSLLAFGKKPLNIAGYVY